MLKAPWTQEQIEALNRYQREGYFQPFTCDGDRGDDAHRAHAEKNGDRDWGLLVATKDGWICPVCGYRQDWAHEWMTRPLPKPPWV